MRVPQLREKAQVIARRKWLVVATVALGLALMTAFLVLARPRYTATLDIIFNSDQGPIFGMKDTEAVYNHLRMESEVANQILIMESPEVARRVIERMNLRDDPEFNRALAPKSQFYTDVYAPAAAFVKARLSLGERRVDPDQRVLEEFLKHLWVGRVPRAQAVTLHFTSHDPVKAAAIVDVVSDVYLNENLEQKYHKLQRTSSWLSDRIRTLRAEVERSERAVEDYRKKHNLFGEQGQTLTADQITNLNMKLIDARVERSAAEAQRDQARRLLRSNGELGTAVQVLQSETIRRFREEELRLERRVAEMSEQYGERHPQIISVRAEQRELRQRIRDEIARIAQSLENQVNAAQAREASLTRDLEALKSADAQFNEASVTLRTLERNSEASRVVLEKMLSSFSEARAQTDMASQVADAQVVSPALIPERPSFPRPLLLLPMALLGAAVAGVGLAFGLEEWDAGLRSAEQVRLATGLSVLAHVPQVRKSKRFGAQLSEYLCRRPTSEFAEAIRSLYARLILIHREPPGVVLVMSSQPGEGKSTISQGLARQQALAGRRVLLLDSDFRRSSLAKSLRLRSRPGLTEFLAGDVDVGDVLQKDPLTGADVIVAGEQWVESPAAASGKLQALIAELKSRYDLIVIDTAPLAAIADALLLAPVADAVTLVVRWRRTSAGVVNASLNQLESAGVHVGGIVLSMVDASKLEGYEYGSYGKTAKYYMG